MKHTTRSQERLLLKSALEPETAVGRRRGAVLGPDGAAPPVAEPEPVAALEVGKEVSFLARVLKVLLAEGHPM